MIISKRHGGWAIAVAGALVLAIAPQSSASYTFQISWESYGAGPLGNFDLDLQVNNGLSGAQAAFNATYGTHSYTALDGSGYFVVHSRFGFVLTNNSPRFFRDQGAGSGALNSISTLAAGDSPTGQAMRWVHETPTVAYNSTSTSKTWTSLWHTFPKSHPFDGEEDPYYIEPTGGCDTETSAPAGKNFPEYGWIGMKQLDNSSNSWPDPNISTLDTKETRLFVGTGYDPSKQSTTNAWAQGTPIDPVPGNTKYEVYSEPGAYQASGVGTLYVAMTGLWCDIDDGQVYGDVVLVKSTNDGATWSYVNTLLTSDDATAIDSEWAYFTASSIHKDPGDNSARLIVTGVKFGAGGLYQGIVEFKFSSLSSGTLVTSGGDPVVQAFEAKETGVHSGAGTFNLSTGKHVQGRVCVGACVPFNEYELNW